MAFSLEIRETKVSCLCLQFCICISLGLWGFKRTRWDLQGFSGKQGGENYGGLERVIILSIDIHGTRIWKHGKPQSTIYHSVTLKEIVIPVLVCTINMIFVYGSFQSIY